MVPYCWTDLACWLRTKWLPLKRCGSGGGLRWRQLWDKGSCVFLRARILLYARALTDGKCTAKVAYAQRIPSFFAQQNAPSPDIAISDCAFRRLDAAGNGLGGSRIVVVFAESWRVRVFVTGSLVPGGLEGIVVTRSV